MQSFWFDGSSLFLKYVIISSPKGRRMYNVLMTLKIISNPFVRNYISETFDRKYKWEFEIYCFTVKSTYISLKLKYQINKEQ